MNKREHLVINMRYLTAIVYSFDLDRSGNKLNLQNKFHITVGMVLYLTLVQFLTLKEQ